MMIKKYIITTFLIVLIWSCVGFTQNPIIQTNYTADPAPMVYNGTVYLYTTHDEDKTVNNFFTMNDWRCYSSTDMVNWTDHGVVLSYPDFSWARGDAWAGQCINRNGKFYFYVPVNKKNGGNSIGVVVSDSPTGPFKDILGHPLLTGYGYIDPTVFIDDDSQAYLYWGNPNLWYVELNKDMVSYNKELGIVEVPLTKEAFHVRYKDTDNRPSAYEEGPWMYKHNDLYYLLYPAGGVPEHLAYSTSSTVIGPWEYQDTIMHVIKQGSAFTNHPGLIDYKGYSYLFYHNGNLPDGGGFKRSVCVEQFEMNVDGTIPLIKPTKEGVKESVSNLNPFHRVEAECIAWEEGIETISDKETGVYVTEISNGDYIKVRGVDFEKGAKIFEASIASVFKDGKIEIHLDILNNNLYGTLDVTSTGGLDQWKVLSCKIKKTKGIHDIFFVFKGSKENLFNFDWWKFS